MAATTDLAALVRSPLTVRALLVELTEQLARSSAVLEPSGEARELLAALLGVQRSWPTLNGDLAIEPDRCNRALAAAAKRARGAPLVYCVGEAAFRDLTLEVDERVLIPRPETEQLVDVALAAAGPDTGGVAIDVGTGSGAVALALAVEGCFASVIGTDVSLDALAVARRNAERLGSRLRAPVEFLQGSLLARLGEVRARLIVSNPPYIADREAATLPPSVRDWEPPIALLSSGGGLYTTARLVRQAAPHLVRGGALVLEADSRRAGDVADLVEADPRFTDVKVIKDLAGRDRFVVARRRGEG
jgi:release factor glutamine methyltransferase